MSFKVCAIVLILSIVFSLLLYYISEYIPFSGHWLNDLVVIVVSILCGVSFVVSYDLINHKGDK